jgi:hypothetical protein
MISEVFSNAGPAKQFAAALPDPKEAERFIQQLHDARSAESVTSEPAYLAQLAKGRKAADHFLEAFKRLLPDDEIAWRRFIEFSFRLALRNPSKAQSCHFTSYVTSHVPLMSQEHESWTLRGKLVDNLRSFLIVGNITGLVDAMLTSRMLA